MSRLNGSREWGPCRTYVVGWDYIDVVKAGETNLTRWRTFMARGAHLIDLREHANITDSLDYEAYLHAVLAEMGPKAFRNAGEAAQFLGNQGAGYTECYRVDPLQFEQWMQENVLWGAA